jgi:hypothetical protein
MPEMRLLFWWNAVSLPCNLVIAFMHKGPAVSDELARGWDCLFSGDGDSRCAHAWMYVLYFSPMTVLFMFSNLLVVKVGAACSLLSDYFLLLSHPSHIVSK